MSSRPMIAALTLGALVTRVHALVTCEPSIIARVILYSHIAQSVEGHGTRVNTGAPPPPRAERRCLELSDTGAHR
jgi:hypothetical protein